MKWCLQSAVILLSTGLSFQPSLLLAQESSPPSQKASDIQETAPAKLSDQDSESINSRQNLCQIGRELSRTKKSKRRTRLNSGAAIVDSPSERKIRRGFPVSKVLGSLAQNEDKKQPKTLKTEPSSDDCE